MATGGGENTSDEIINIKCCFCFENNRTREADKFCVECKDYYCSPCIDTHKKFPATKGHKLLDKTDFRSLGPDGSLPCFPTQRCDQHQSEVLNLYCKQHDEVACATCIALSHSCKTKSLQCSKLKFGKICSRIACPNIHSIAEEIDNLYNRTQMTSIKQKIPMKRDSMEQVKKAKERKVKELKKAFDKEVQSIKAFRKELETLLNKMEQESIKELKKEYDRIELNLTVEINCANNLIGDINEVTSQLKKAEGNKAQEYVSIKTAEKLTSKTEKLEKEEQEQSEETVSFKFDQNIKTLLQQILTLGKVSVKIDKGINNEVNTLNIKDGLYKIKYQREIDVKLVNDKSSICSIHGSCITEDGYLLLSDCKNNRLKRLDMTTATVKDYVDFETKPWGICLINKTEVAVALDNNTVQFLSLGNKLTVTRTLQMKHACYGIAHIDSKLYISDFWTTVYIYSMNGSELKRISTDASGKKIFQDTRHITFNAEGDKLFVADEIKGLVILDIHGNHLTTLTDPTLSGAYGVCTDGKNLFVCNFNSNNIVQLGQDYKLLGELCKVTRPLSLCFDKHKTMMIATLDNNNKISVFELE